MGCCTPETIIMFHVNYASIKKKTNKPMHNEKMGTLHESHIKRDTSYHKHVKRASMSLRNSILNKR